MVLHILRGSFLLLVASVAALYVLPFQATAELKLSEVAFMIAASLGIAGVIVAIDFQTRKKKLSALSGVFLGLIAGLVAAYALSFVVDLVGLLTSPELDFEAPRTATELRNLTTEERALLEQRDSYLKLLEGVKVFIGLTTCYLGISLVIQTKDDFRFVIPYVEFAKQVRGTKPILLDTSVLIDGRILDILETNVLQGSLILPKFVLEELQLVADSADKLKRARGRRGLEILQKLQENTIIPVSVDESDVEGASADQKLISLAQEVPARVMTNDYNLNRIATVRGVDVININDLAKAMRPVALPGEPMHVRIIKPGESGNQGVGYLDDGTMVVVENGRKSIGQEIDIQVTSTLQTSAGRMVFGRLTEGTTNGTDGNEAVTPEAARNPESANAAASGPRSAGRNPRRTYQS